MRKNKELISDEISEIINHRPNRIIRSGNLVLLVILLLLLGFTWFIHYPDVIPGSARVVAINAPKLVKARTEGKIEKLLVNDEEKVRAGQHLLYLQSSANHEQVLALKSWIQQVLADSSPNFQLINEHPLPVLDRLGEVQESYNSLAGQTFELKQVLSSGYYLQKKAAIQKDMSYLSGMQKTLADQKEIIDQGKQLQQKEYEAYEKLASDKVIAPLELDQYKRKLLTEQYSSKQADAQLTNSILTRHNKQKELLDLDKTMQNVQNDFYSALFNTLNNIEKWIQQYVLTAPDSGKVFFMGVLQENQLISNGQELLFIQLPDSKYYGDMRVGQNRFGKVKLGQKTILKVTSYPSSEFGYLVGNVSHISNIPNGNDSFVVRIDLPDGLKTNYDRDLFFRNNLSTQAEIITDNSRLLTRILQKFRAN